MPTLEELDSDIRVAFFGKWAGVDAGLKVPAPDPEELCHLCIFAIGSRSTGASVKTDDGDWVHYHGQCWLEAKDESLARDTVRDSLEAEDVDPW